MTGHFGNWNGDVTAIGPLYPFVGSETLLVLLALICWIGWHILQIRTESRQYDEEVRALRQDDALLRYMEEEHTIERM